MKTSDKILTFTAVFISCLALVVSIVQTNILLKQSHAAVWPRLANGQGHGPDYYVYSVINEGVGPAIITDVEYTYEDTSFYKMNDIVHYFTKLEEIEIGRPVVCNFNYGNVYKGSVLNPSDNPDYGKVFIANDSVAVKIGKKYLSRTNIKIDYCSIYDRCWRMQNDDIIELN